MVNFSLANEEIDILKSVIGKTLLKIRHDPLDKFDGEGVYGRVELFFEQSIVLINYDYKPYNLFGLEGSDHPKFSISLISEDEAISALENTAQINVKYNSKIESITLVEDLVDVKWDNKSDNVKTLIAIMFKLDGKEFALQGDYMIPMINIFKGDNLLEEMPSPGYEFGSDSETTYNAKRILIEL